MRAWQYLCISIGFFAAAAVAADAPAEAASAAGREAFAQGDYSGALQHFIDARRAGLDSPQLSYNLGVTYYRLGRYHEARQEFEGLLGDAEQAANAHYNLGLIALKLNDTRAAREHFQQAHDTTDSEALRALAARALVQAQPRAVASRRTAGVLSLGAGYDSNVALVRDADQIGTRDEGDAFGEVLAGVRHPLGESWELDAAFYLRHYADVDAFDQSSLRLGMMHRTTGEVWRSGIGAHAERLFLGGEVFQSAGTLTLEAARPFQDGAELRLRYRPSRIVAEAPYEYLTGWRHRAGVQLRSPLAEASLTLGYELELNDRDDLPQDEPFASRSPQRNALSAQLGYPLSRAWDLTVAGRYRYSRFEQETIGPPRLGISTNRRRVDEEYEMELRLDRILTRHWYLFGRHLYTHNQSNDPEFDYSRHETMLGLERLF
ncbi:tetratricopeptide repeat protein [Ectothiorhodospiraceae bacterium 2226]|nr:tetratricopeptide repeat protein [Ectothiorhodospiraceae bacterium 2226]